MDTEDLKRVFAEEFDRVYSQAWMDGFIAGALEGAKQMQEKEIYERTGKSQYPA